MSRVILAAGDAIPVEHHVVKYIKPTLLDDGLGAVDGNAFLSRPSDSMRSSYYWLEHFEGTFDLQLQSVRDQCTLKLAAGGKFARLSVGKTLAELAAQFDTLNAQIVYEPDPPEYSHSVMHDIPEQDSSSEAEYIGDAIRDSVLDYFPARGEKS